MSRYLVVIVVAALSCLSALGDAKSTQASTISVDSTAFVFSPGNWVGETGRSGGGYRQTWNPGAYFRVAWESAKGEPGPTLLFDTATYDGSFRSPTLDCQLDGVWSSGVRCAAEVQLPAPKTDGKHVLTVYVASTVQAERWGTPGTSGKNVVRVRGLRLPAGAKPLSASADRKWALIVGDSITEGIGAGKLEGYSHLLGQALRVQGYEYAISACGWSGWLNRGDKPPGDVPGYYVISDSTDGAGGRYHDDASRWNKIDANHSVLDARGRISAYGEVDQEPALILINYGTNDVLHRSNRSDVRASMAQSLRALRQAAPSARIVLLVPFGQYLASELHETVRAYKVEHPQDKQVSLIDLGRDTARALHAKKGYWGGLHPNPRGHATFAAQLIPQLLAP